MITKSYGSVVCAIDFYGIAEKIEDAAIGDPVAIL